MLSWKKTSAWTISNALDLYVCLQNRELVNLGAVKLPFIDISSGYDGFKVSLSQESACSIVERKHSRIHIMLSCNRAGRETRLLSSNELESFFSFGYHVYCVCLTLSPVHHTASIQMKGNCPSRCLDLYAKKICWFVQLGLEVNTTNGLVSLSRSSSVSIIVLVCGAISPLTTSSHLLPIAILPVLPSDGPIFSFRA